MTNFVSPIKNLADAAVQFYASDSGVDIHVASGTECRAISDGKIIYSEPGHTAWNSGVDTPNSILVQLDKPYSAGGKTYKYFWFTHLSKLYISVPDGSSQRSVKAGDPLGQTGYGNQVAHLHMGLIVNRAQASPSDWMAPAELAALAKTWGEPGAVSASGDDLAGRLKVACHGGKLTFTAAEDICLKKGEQFSFNMPETEIKLKML